MQLSSQSWRPHHFSQQEPGIAGYLSNYEALVKDFAGKDVYRGLGFRMGLLTADMSEERIRSIRTSILKALMLSIIYGKSAHGIARDLPEFPGPVVGLGLFSIGRTALG
jgi:hypothetical protein